MTLQEIREKVKHSESVEWLNEVAANIDYVHINFKISLKGIVAVYEFFQQQADGWDKKQSTLPEDLERSRTFFKDIKKRIAELVNEDVASYSRRNEWQVIQSEIENTRRKYFTYNCPETDFLIEVANNFPESFAGAYKFITNTLPSSFNNKNEYIGTLMAYEFSLKDHTKILERRNHERASIGKIRSDFTTYLNESESQIKDFIQRTDDKCKDYIVAVDELKELKEKIFNEWFELSQGKFNSFHDVSNEKIKDLEKTYEELLRLKKPAEYWNKRAALLKKEGQGFLKWLVLLVLFGCITLYFLLWLTPEGMLLSFIKGQASAIKWSIVYVTFISLLAFGIRAVSKVMFSSFHLARDAEEREHLTVVYLALIKESAVEEKDKNLIMQSLFSRADTGLLKEDSGPTMPGNIPNKLMQ